MQKEKLTVLTNPKLEEAAAAIEKAFAQRKTLIVAGKCRVRYAGRANSTLEPGERILIIKADGSLLVHRPVGYEPVNWQPSGSVFHVHAKADAVEVHAVRQKPRESVTVTFSEIFMVAVLSLADSGEFALYASEEDMHRAILLQPSLLEEGFTPISYEKKVEPGFVDVYGMDNHGRLVVVEVKRRIAGKEAVLQLAKYIEAIKGKADREVRGVLAAPALGKDGRRLLAMLGLEFKVLDPKKCAEILRKTEGKKLEEFFKQ
ncbi:MAG: endonuclease NucS [Candidatus Bathyarchaeota archaeon]|nr:endonuclease NucS [Candidatus Bathyarchaeota archaeon]